MVLRLLGISFFFLFYILLFFLGVVRGVFFGIERNVLLWYTKKCFRGVIFLFCDVLSSYLS